MKLGILGGSFNPIHLGHLFLADKVLCKLKLDRVVFIPAFQSPFKLSDEDAFFLEKNAENRLDMLAAAITGDSRFAIDECEIMRRGVSYTVDTLEDIIERYQPNGKLTLIIGDDLAAELSRWRNSEKIMQLADIVIARRIDSPSAEHLGKITYPHTFIDNEVMNISSYQVRQRIKEGSDWRSLVPSQVSAIIEDRQLYGYRSDNRVDNQVSDAGAVQAEEPVVWTQELIQRVEAAARAALSRERFLHSRSTALHASDMCKRFGLDPAAGYLAGIAHDLAKQIDGKQLLKMAKKADLKITALDKHKPSLLHGRVATVLLKEQFSIHNKEVLEAVACHTSGSENMGPLAKVVYIADKTESTRSVDPVLRKMCREAGLNSILFAVLQKTVRKLQARKLDLSEDTLRLLDKMKER